MYTAVKRENTADTTAARLREARAQTERQRDARDRRDRHPNQTLADACLVTSTADTRRIREETEATNAWKELDTARTDKTTAMAQKDALRKESLN